MWRITSTTPVGLRLARRTLCVPATLTSDTVQTSRPLPLPIPLSSMVCQCPQRKLPLSLLAAQLQSTITDFKAKYEEKYASPYSAEKLALDLKVGSVDSSKVKQMFEFNDFLNKARSTPHREPACVMGHLAPPRSPPP